MSTSTVTDKIVALVTPILSDLHLDLYDLEFNGGVLKITVDTPPGSDGGVTLEQLSLVTRLVGRDFDHHDPIPGHYTLEVSSPGLERTLRRPDHFRRAIGETVSVKTREDQGEIRRVRGQLTGADELAITLGPATDDASGESRRIAYDDIVQARTVFEWGAAAKPGNVAKKVKT